MRIRNLLSLASVAVLVAAVSTSSCRKENGIDNNQVIQKPYSLFVSDSAGGLYISNNGEQYKEFFKTDGVTDRGIVIAGKNVLWAKSNLYLSEDNNAFNVTFSQLPYATDAPWATLMHYSTARKLVYVACRNGTGIALSTNYGKSWVFDTTVVGGPITVSSFTELNSGILAAYDNKNHRVYAQFSPTSNWFSLRSTPPSTGNYQLAAYESTLVAYDYSGTNGAWYTVDTGKNWKQFSGIPSNERLLSAVAPFGQNLLIGTDNGKVYRLDNGTFVLSNKGIMAGSVVRGLAAKNNIYKKDASGNSREIRYVYAATSTGLYRSEDGGLNWVATIPGNFQSIY